MKLRSLLPLNFTAIVCLATITAQAREPAVPESDLIPVELASVAVVPLTGAPVALLHEPESGAIVPIFIGAAEARAILLALHKVAVPRPMTHDLMTDLVGVMGAELNKVVVDELRDGTYYGFLELHVSGSENPVLIDTRPSDGMALAARTGSPILVAPAVLEAGAALSYEGLGDEEQVATAMGITVVKITDELRQALDLPDKPGVLVSGVDKLTPAREIETGAVILEVNGEAPEDPMAFLALVGKTPAGQKARLRYWQNGKEKNTRLPTNVSRTPPEAHKRL